MFIDKRNKYLRAAVFPFTGNEQETAWQARIDINKDGTVWWNGKPVTAQEIFERYGKLLAAFGKAFEIAGEGDDAE